MSRVDCPLHAWINAVKGVGTPGGGWRGDDGGFGCGGEGWQRDTAQGEPPPDKPTSVSLEEYAAARWCPWYLRRYGRPSDNHLRKFVAHLTELGGKPYSVAAVILASLTCGPAREGALAGRIHECY